MTRGHLLLLASLKLSR